MNASAVFRYEGDDTATIVGRHSREGSPDAFTLGMRLPADENTGIGRVLRTGTPARIHDYSDREGETADNGLRDRAEAVGGTLFVISPPGKGTLVTSQLPLSPA